MILKLKIQRAYTLNILNFKPVLQKLLQLVNLTSSSTNITI